MAIVQCENHHYYDDERDEICPYCTKLEKESVFEDTTNSLEEQPTVFKLDNDFENEVMTETYGECPDSDDLTIGIFSIKESNLLVVGWLVCIEGLQKGMSYPIYSGRNFVGRNFNMDIVLSDDEEISREKHFSIIYDPKSVKFYVVEGAGITYINKNSVIGTVQMFENDVITVGTAKYCFVPFCKGERTW